MNIRRKRIRRTAYGLIGVAAVATITLGFERDELAPGVRKTPHFDHMRGPSGYPSLPHSPAN